MYLESKPSDSSIVVGCSVGRSVAAVDTKRGYVQRALGTARVWSGVVQEQHVRGPKIIYSYYTRYALIRDEFFIMIICNSS